MTVASGSADASGASGASDVSGASVAAAEAPSTHERPTSGATSRTARDGGAMRPRATWRGWNIVTTSSTQSAHTAGGTSMGRSTATAGPDPSAAARRSCRWTRVSCT